MRLLQLTLTNFQGVKVMIATPQGKNMTIYGTNGAGKTTFYNALTWLLYDKASTGEKGFSPKTKGADGTDIHNIENCVEGIFKLADGTQLTLKKTMSEIWTNKRGSQISTLTGNTTSYTIDGVPATKSEYDKRLDEICSPTKAMTLTQPEYFAESIKWQDRRELLLQICGDISEYDVINSSDELNGITPYLLKGGSSGQFYTVEEFQKIATARTKVINARLDEIPARIDEATKAMPEIIGSDDESDITAQITELEREKNVLISKKAELLHGDASQQIRNRIAVINTELVTAKAKYDENCYKSLEVQRSEITSIQDKLLRNDYLVSSLKATVSQTSVQLNTMKEQRERLVAKHSAEAEKVFKGESICPTCGQVLPAEKIESAREEFNKAKAQMLERIRADIEATCSRTAISQLEEKLEADRIAYKNAINVSEELRAVISEKEHEIPKTMPFYETAVYAALTEEKAKLEEELNTGSADASVAIAEMQREIDGVGVRISALQSNLAAVKLREEQRLRVRILEEEEKELNTEYERLMKGIYLCETFIKTKVSMLNEKINSHFKNVRFRLFEEQLNGGIKECCDVMIPCGGALVPFASANAASRIAAGLEIIDTLGEHWGIRMPVVVDNAESIVALPDIAAQVIRLVVSEADTVLRMEVAE